MMLRATCYVQCDDCGKYGEFEVSQSTDTRKRISPDGWRHAQVIVGYDGVVRVARSEDDQNLVTVLLMCSDACQAMFWSQSPYDELNKR